MIPPDDLSALSMEQLFQMEAETQCAVLSDGLLALESQPASPDLLASLMRAAHSLKGAARIVGSSRAVQVAHAMEDCFVLAQKDSRILTSACVGLLLQGVDLLRRADPAEAAVAEFVERCAALSQSQAPPPASLSQAPSPLPTVETAPLAGERGGQVLRVGADKLDRLLGFAGEGVVAARQLETFQADFHRAGQALRHAASRLPSAHTPPAGRDELLRECRELLASLQATLLERHAALDAFSRRWNLQAGHLYQEALACRMRPLADILPGLRRLARDLSLELGKPAHLEVVGEDTPVDREILERLEAPLTHLLRNAIDHGLESPAERHAAGKPEKGRLVLEARHVGGQLAITLSDDGRGVDLDAMRARIVERGMAAPATVATMSEAEIVDFLFLPGFSMRDQVTEISGRGVGLDAVQSMARSVRGTVRAQLRAAHRGFAFELRLPISLSVLRSLLVTIAGEPYAFPLAHLERALRIPLDAVESSEGRQFFTWQDLRVPLASARQILGLGAAENPAAAVSVLLLGHSDRRHGVVVDDFLGERDLVVQPLDPALGKIPGIAAASLTTEGAPLLVVDVDDFAAAMERLVVTRAGQVVPSGARAAGTRRQRILVVEDSLTVRELERKLLLDCGYAVDVAVDGSDGWTALRRGGFDLVLTDVDMPRMDGIELTRLIKADPRFRDLPVMIVSYKDREEDRRRGLDAGADYYLTKGSFQDRTLLDAVRDLIGEAPAEP